jgi:single-strand selective monofunctional uracil DNA glycosylase
MDTADRVFHAAQRLSLAFETIPAFPPRPAVTACDPTIYCADYFRAYLERAASGPRRCLIVGMNPSPHGQAQNGVPFGDVSYARRIVEGYIPGDALPKPRLSDPFTLWGEGIQKPLFEACGLDYPRGEESGKRLWGLLERLCGSLGAALERCLPINYCPLLMLDADGGSVTPSDLPRTADATRAMEAACDAWLRELVEISEARCAVVLGGYVEKSAQRALAGAPIEVVRLTHPSPRAGSAHAWAAATTPVLARCLGVA